MLTFIIPSVGRPTLKNSLQSLIDQYDQQWQCVVGFDGLLKEQVDPNILIDDDRIQYYYFPEKQGYTLPGWVNPGAGAVRQKLLDITTTPWYAFLDDDDTLSWEYVSKFKMSLEENPLMDMMIFRMVYNTNIPRYADISPDYMVPEVHLTDPYTLQRGQIGISQCVRREFIMSHNIKWTTGCVEDLEYLHQFVFNDAHIVLSDIVGYFVGGKG